MKTSKKSRDLKKNKIRLFLYGYMYTFASIDL